MAETIIFRLNICQMEKWLETCYVIQGSHCTWASNFYDIYGGKQRHISRDDNYNKFPIGYTFR